MRAADDTQKRLFEFSIGDLRLFDSLLEKAGQKKAAGLLRDVLLDWRAYPSRTVYSPAQLRGYAATLSKVASALRKAGLKPAAAHVAGIVTKLRAWSAPK